MPASFGEIANYHSRLAVQYLALARKARDAGDLNAAEYNHQLAARYVEAAQEQTLTMSQEPGRFAPPRAPRSQAAPQRAAVAELIPKRTAWVVACLSAIRHTLSGSNDSLQGLSLRDISCTPTPAPTPGLGV